MNKKWVVAIVLVLVLPAMACISVDLGRETPEPEVAESPVLPPSTEVAIETPTQLPPSSPTPTTPPEPEGPSVSGLFFAADVTDAGEPIDVATSFPAGTIIVYAFGNYVGMSDGAASESVWYLDGEEVVRTPFNWSIGDSGEAWIAYVQGEGGTALPPGRYDWELYVEEELVITGSFPVGAAALFEDDFSDPGSGWEVGTYETGSLAYSDGSYSVTSFGDGNMMWGLAGRSFQDLIIEVDATQVSAGPEDDNAFGVMCRVQPNDDGYVLRISGDGFYAIHKIEDGDFEALVDWSTSGIIRQGDATNRIRAVCDASDLALLVNGELLADASDSTFSEGDIALTVTSFEEEATEVHFDNLVGSAPRPSAQLPAPAPQPTPTRVPAPPPPPPTATPIATTGCPPNMACIEVTSTCGEVTLTIGGQAYTIPPEPRTGPPVVVQVSPGQYSYTASIVDRRYEDINGNLTLVIGWNQPLNFWCQPT